MVKLTKWLYLSMLFLVLLTLVKESPPYRLYLLDVGLIPFLVVVLLQKLIEPGRLNFKWQGVDTLMVMLFIAITAAFVFSGSKVQSTVEYIDWLRIVTIYFTSRMVLTGTVNERALRYYFWAATIMLLGIGMIQILTGSSFGLVGNYFGDSLDQGMAANVEGYGLRNPLVFEPKYYST